MLLRVSSEIEGAPADVRAIREDAAAAGSGVPHAAELLAFAEAVLGDDDAVLDVARKDLLEAVGSEAFVDAAGVVGNFQRMVRIADGTGIPLDAPMKVMSESLREEIGVGEFASAANTQPLGAVGRRIAKALAPLTAPIFRLVGGRYGGRAD